MLRRILPFFWLTLWPGGYARMYSVSVTVNEGRSHRSNQITPAPFSRSAMIGSGKARWKVTLRVRIFEVLQV